MIARCYRLAALLLVLLSAGCAGYRVGSLLNADYKTVAVPMFRNKSYKPQTEAQVTNAILKRFQSEGSLQVVNEADADLLVTGTITEFARAELRSVREDTDIVREYRITIKAEIAAINRRTGEVVLKKTTVTGSADTFIGSDLQSAEYQALPLVADDLAKKVVTLLTESW